MSEEVTEKKTLRLTNTVVRRVTPMTAKGCDLLRAVRENMVKEMEESTGIRYDIPFPVVVHQLIVEYCKLKGIEPHVRSTDDSITV